MNAMKRAADDARATLKAAWRCWAAWRALLNGELSRDDTVPSTATLGEIENRTSALDASTSLLDRSLDEAGGAFESIAREPYDAGPVQAGSAHRAVLKLAQFYLDESRLLLDEYLSGDPPIRWVGEDELRRQFAFRLQHLVDVDEFDRNRLGPS